MNPNHISKLKKKIQLHVQKLLPEGPAEIWFREDDSAYFAFTKMEPDSTLVFGRTDGINFEDEIKEVSHGEILNRIERLNLDRFECYSIRG